MTIIITKRVMLERLPKKFNVGYFAPNDDYKVENKIKKCRLIKMLQNKYLYSGICIMTEDKKYTETSSKDWLIN